MTSTPSTSLEGRSNGGSARTPGARIRSLRDKAFALADSLSDPARVDALAASEVALTHRGLAGHAGMALFFAAILQLSDRPHYRTAMHAYMRAAAHGTDSEGGLFTGIAGLLAASNYATLVEPRYTGLREKCTTASLALEARLRAAQTYRDYDIVSGAAGRALALASLDVPGLAGNACHYLAWLLQDSSRWYCPHPSAPEDGSRFDLGLAHGLAGMLAALTLASPSETEYDDAIRKGVDVLSANRTLDGAGWPARISIGERAPHIGRSAWCYGTPGCASALFLGARRIGDSRAEHLALDCLRALLRVPRESWMLSDHAICHGSAGVALVYFSIGEASGDHELSSFALSMAESIADSWQAHVPFAFQARARTGRLLDAPGLLDGAAGIGLTLLTVTGSCKSDWLQLFGLQPGERASNAPAMSR